MSKKNVVSLLILSFIFCIIVGYNGFYIGWAFECAKENGDRLEIDWAYRSFIWWGICFTAMVIITLGQFVLGLFHYFGMNDSRG